MKYIHVYAIIKTFRIIIQRTITMQLKQFTVKNFRGLRDFTCNDFAQITVIGGKNNCGKTTFLESLFVLSGMGNARASYDINFLRRVPVAGVRDLESLFFASDQTKQIKLNATFDDGSMRNLTIEALNSKNIAYKNNDNVVNPVVSNDNDFNSIVHTFSLETKDHKHEEGKSSLTNGKMGFELGTSKTYKETWFALYVSSKAHLLDSERIKRMMLKKEEKEILLNVLKKVEPLIVDLSLVNDSIYVNLEDLPKALPVEVFGDGMILIISFIANLRDCQNGLFLIDEADSGLHFSTLNIFIKLIVKYAKLWNVQVVMTTHNKDFLKSFSLLQEEINDEDFSYLNMVKREDKSIVIFPYTKSELSASMQQGWEIR